MEKQTQVREIVTNTNRSVNYMPQPSPTQWRSSMRGDTDPRRWDRTSGDRSGGVKKDAERELEKPIRYDEVKVVVKKLNVRREANTISDLQTNLVAVASFRPIHRSRRYQTHPPISLLSSFTSLFLSIYLSLSLSHDQCLFFRKTEFFCNVFFVDLVYIFRFPIIIFRPTHLKSFYIEPNLGFCSCFYVLVCSCFKFFYFILLLQ